MDHGHFGQNERFSCYNPPMDRKTAAAYNRHATELAAFYGTEPPPWLAGIGGLIPPGSRILDIGAGTGRDLHHLVRAGYDTWGTEPSRRLRREGRRIFPETAERLIKGALPDRFATLIRKVGPRPFDLILLSAVLQHLPDRELSAAFGRIGRLLAVTGAVMISHPVRYPTDATGRDPKGRLYRLRDPEEYAALAAAIGLREVSREFRDDGKGREGIEWVLQVFRRGEKNAAV